LEGLNVELDLMQRVRIEVSVNWPGVTKMENRVSDGFELKRIRGLVKDTPSPDSLDLVRHAY
jgi:hypothetical protein